MSAHKKQLEDEGTISFVIRGENNPPFKDPESNINFMLNKDMDGFFLTILKEKENIRIDIDNPTYGKTKIVHHIARYLNDDMTVTLTWKKYIIKLFLNGKLVEESTLKKHGNIDVELSADLEELFKITNLSKDDVFLTINDRHRGLIIPGNPLRMGAIHWFNSKIVFVVGAVTKSNTIKNILRFDEVTVNLALKLKNILPAGDISKDMDFDQILSVVAESFGVPVTTSKNSQARKYHAESDWDGEIVFATKNDKEVIIQGTFNPDKKKCNHVWGFSLEKYRTWFEDSFS